MRWNDQRWYKRVAQLRSFHAHLLVLELDQGVVVTDDLVAEVLGRREEFRQPKPLPGHLVPVVGVDELVVVHARYS